MTRPEGCFTVFGRNGVMPGQPGSGQKEEEGRRRGALREFWPDTPL